MVDLLVELGAGPTLQDDAFDSTLPAGRNMRITTLGTPSETRRGEGPR